MKVQFTQRLAGVALIALLCGMMPLALHAQASGAAGSGANAATTANTKATAPAATPATAPMTATKAKNASTKASTTASTTPKAVPQPHPGDVWVSSGAKVYHTADSRWAGNTKSGQWMSEADAQKAGYKKANN